MFNKMYTHSDDDNVTTSGALITEDLKVELDETNAIVYQVIRK